MMNTLKLFSLMVAVILFFHSSNMYAQDWRNTAKQIGNAARETAKANEAKRRSEAEASRQQNTSNSAQQPGNASGNSNIIGNNNSRERTTPIASVITPWTKFTNTFVEIDSKTYQQYGQPISYYIISYTDGNLYHRVWESNRYIKEEFILKDVKEIYSTYVPDTNGKLSFFAVKNDGSLWAWGDNSVGQLGDDTGINKTVPIKIMDNVRETVVYEGSVCVVKKDGTMYAWGNNNYGQLGVGDFDNKYAPIKLPLANVSYIYYEDEFWSQGGFGGVLPNIRVITLSGDEYKLGGKSIGRKLIGKPELVGKHDYNVYFFDNTTTTGKNMKYKLMPNGELYKDNNLIASNVSFAGGYPYSYITRNGELYSWGEAPIGDGSNIPRKDPVFVLPNIIQLATNKNNRYALSSEGKLYSVDSKNTFKYEEIVNSVYLLMSGYNDVNILNSGVSLSASRFFTNYGSVYEIRDKNYLLLKDVALPQIEYEIKP